MASSSEKSILFASPYAFTATVITSLLAGFFFGRLYPSRGQSKHFGSNGSREKMAEEISTVDEEDDSSESGDESDWATEESKLVLVVRTELGMTKGKIAAQCGHATLACYKALLGRPSSIPLLRRWERHGQAKVALQVRSEEQLELLQAQAISLGLCAHIVHDQGRTQIASGSATVLGVGPGPKSIIDQVTGQLKLL